MVSILDAVIATIRNSKNKADAKENIIYYKEILNASRGVLDEYKKRYEQGQVMLLHLLQVETAHQENVREYINAVQVYYDAYLSLMQNVGHDILLEDEI